MQHDQQFIESMRRDANEAIRQVEVTIEGLKNTHYADTAEFIGNQYIACIRLLFLEGDQPMLKSDVRYELLDKLYCGAQDSFGKCLEFYRVVHPVEYEEKFPPQPPAQGLFEQILGQVDAGGPLFTTPMAGKDKPL